MKTTFVILTISLLLVGSVSNCFAGKAAVNQITAPDQSGKYELGQRGLVNEITAPDQEGKYELGQRGLVN
jgi:hypothetical protein